MFDQKYFAGLKIFLLTSDLCQVWRDCRRCSRVAGGQGQEAGAVPPQHSAGEVTGVTRRPEEIRSQDDVLAGELLLHQGGVRHQVQPLELSKNIPVVSQCPHKAPTKDLSLLKVLT